MTMREKIAAAIYVRVGPSMPPWENVSDRNYWLFAADAALAALREPTEKMVEAAFDVEAAASCSIYGDEAKLVPSGAIAVWQAMIDATNA